MRLALLASLALLLASCGSNSGVVDLNTREVGLPNGKRIQAEIMKSPDEMMRGMMFRDSLAKDTGLLMPFDYERRHEIWMMGMRFPIDIIFIGADKRVVDVAHSAKPMGWNPMTWRLYWPKKPCTYVLEVSAGLAKATGTEAGDALDF